MPWARASALDRHDVESQAWQLTTGCWLWMGQFRSNGYGQVPQRYGGYAHRAAYQAFVGSIPAGGVVMHDCDNKWCVNPDHLRLGTSSMNNLDAWRRHLRQPKLSPEIAAEIRAAPTSHAEEARRRGVSASAIKGVRYGRLYALGESVST